MQHDQTEALELPDAGAMRAKLVEWDQQPMEQGGLSVVVLRNVAAPRVAVNRWAFSRGETNISELAEKIVSDVEHDAKHLPGARQDYIAEALFGGDRHPSRQHRMRAHFRSPEDDLGLSVAHGAAGTKDATQMRLHAADTMQFGLGMAKELRKTARGSNEQLSTMVQILTARNLKLEADLEAAKEAVDEALDKTAEREAKAKQQAEFLKYCRELFDLAKNFLPIALAYATNGKFPLPDHAHPVIEQFKNLYNAITKDDATQAAVLEALSKSEAATVAFGGIIATLEDARLLEEKRAEFAAKAEDTGAKSGAMVKKASPGLGLFDTLRTLRL